MRRTDVFWPTAIVVLSLMVASPPAGAERIVAVGDIHGSFDGLTRILQKVQLIDENHQWIGGSSTFVQTGDYLDRGEQIREVLDFLKGLEKPADRAGGKVIVLLGNHETMNLLRLTRDVAPAVYRSFIDKKSDERREDGLKRYLESIENRVGDTEDLPPPSDADRQAWLDAHPPGYIEYLEAMSPDGDYGKWLKKRPVAARVGDIAFMHAGANPAIAQWQSIEELNELVEEEIDAFNNAFQFLRSRRYASPGSDLSDVMAASSAALTQFLELAAQRDRKDLERRWPQKHVLNLRRLQDIDQWTVIQPDKALWFRGLATWEETEEASLSAFLKLVDAQCIVAGHSVLTPPEIRMRFDRRVFLIDTGMLSSHYQGGRPSALVFEDQRIVAHYLDETVVLAEGRGRCR